MILVIASIVFFSTESASSKASATVKFLSVFVKSRLFGMTKRVSICSVNFSIPASADFSFLQPSKEKGFVTTAMDKMFISLHKRAITGVAPVPVPPPMPAVRIAMLHPLRIDLIASSLSSAEAQPISGLPPAPKPPVSFGPIVRVCAAWELFKTI